MSKPASDRDANAAVALALFSLPMLAIVAGVTDLAGAYRQRAALQDALDDAMAAAGQVAGMDADRQRVAEGLFYPRVAQLGVRGASIATGPVGESGTLSGDARALYPTRMLSVVSLKSIIINVHSEVKAAGGGRRRVEAVKGGP